MTQPRVTGRRPGAVRLAGIGVLAVGVTAAVYVAGRVLTTDYAFGLFGRVGLGAVALKSLLATIALGVAILQVLLALWMHRRLPFTDSPPGPVRLAHRRRAAPAVGTRRPPCPPRGRDPSAPPGTPRAAKRSGTLRISSDQATATRVPPRASSSRSTARPLRSPPTAAWIVRGWSHRCSRTSRRSW